MQHKVLQRLIGIIIFIASAVIAAFYEEYFRILIRYFYRYSTNENINFSGKNFHFFASGEFILSFGLFCVFVYYTCRGLSVKNKVAHLLLVSALFMMSIFVISYVDSNGRIMACTACRNEKLVLHYNALNYDFIFITGLVISILPLLINLIRGFSAKK